jgi:alanyl aminopeptidase
VCAAGGARLELSAARDRPAGSAAPPASYTLPVCARWEAGGALGEACTVVERGRGAIPLPACPRWFLPDAGGAGYHRWWMASHDLERLRDAGFAHLSAAERLSWARSVVAAARAGRVAYREALELLGPLARDGAHAVALAPAPLFLGAIELVPELARRRVRSATADLYLPRLRALGLDPAPGEPAERGRLRAELAVLLQRARDGETVRALAARGLAWAGLADGRFHPEAVSPGLAGAALSAAVTEGDPALYEALEARLPPPSEVEARAAVVAALGAAREPALSARALTLATARVSPLSPEERLGILRSQAAEPETRDAAWRAATSRWDDLAQALPPALLGEVPRVAAGFCEAGRAADVRRAFASRAAALPAVRQAAEETAEAITLCAALRAAQGASAAEYFRLR